MLFLKYLKIQLGTGLKISLSDYQNVYVGHSKLLLECQLFTALLIMFERFLCNYSAQQNYFKFVYLVKF